MRVYGKGMHMWFGSVACKAAIAMYVATGKRGHITFVWVLLFLFLINHMMSFPPRPTRRCHRRCPILLSLFIRFRTIRIVAISNCYGNCECGGCNGSGNDIF